MNPYEPAKPGAVVSSDAEISVPISWRAHLVLFATALVAWVAFIFGLALSMRNMFGGPAPDNWGAVFVIASALVATGGLIYFVVSPSRRSAAIQTVAQRLVLILLLLANIVAAGQVILGILSYAGRG